MPTLLRSCPAVAFEVGLLLGRRESRRFTRVKTYGDNVEFLANIKRDIEQGTHQAVEHHGAQHGTTIVGEHQNDWLVLKIIAQLNGLSRLIPELQIERHLRIQTLVEADAPQHGREAGFSPRGTHK